MILKNNTLKAKKNGKIILKNKVTNKKTKLVKIIFTFLPIIIIFGKVTDNHIFNNIIDNGISNIIHNKTISQYVNENFTEIKLHDLDKKLPIKLYTTKFLSFFYEKSHNMSILKTSDQMNFRNNMEIQNNCIPPGEAANLIGIRNDIQAFKQLITLIPKTCTLNNKQLFKILQSTNLQDDLLYAKAACELLSRSTSTLHQDMLKKITKNIRGDKNRGIFNTCYRKEFYYA